MVGKEHICLIIQNRERKHLIIVKEYHMQILNPILCKEKNIIKETSEEEWWELFRDHVP